MAQDKDIHNKITIPKNQKIEQNITKKISLKRSTKGKNIIIKIIEYCYEKLKQIFGFIKKNIFTSSADSKLVQQDVHTHSSRRSFIRKGVSKTPSTNQTILSVKNNEGSGVDKK